jgi:prepilin-type N-terminal cleavage/methylation domain-containing protein/prepilin-type processing-associated H-X9-DG protein
MKRIIKSRTVIHKGFTLVELLVVIAIIALLLSILMPSLQKARENAKRVVCAARLHQIHFANEFYAQDYNGKYMHLWAYPLSWGDSNPPDFSDATVFLVGGKKGEGYSGGANYRPERRILNKYVNNNYELFHCPGDKGMKMMLTYGRSNWGLLGNSFEYNGYGNNYWDYYGSGKDRYPKNRGWANRKIGTVKQPAIKISFGDAVMHTFMNGQQWEGEYGWHSKQRNMSNIVFGDGHTAYIQIIYDKNATGEDKYQRGPGYDFLCDR